ncbi:MAG TPA: glycosyltransferase family 39 protein [Anaerolineales bacterium]|nr:glycosyltransferase family 39 protein [Anaerolineales bacterium]
MRGIHTILLIVILLSAFVIGASTLTRGHEWGDDFASYIMQAQSILNGNTDEFIEHNTFTIFESSLQIGPVAYPWGYPLALIPPLLLKGLHPLALKLPGLFFFAAFLICLYWLTEDRLTPTERLILVSLCAFNPIFIEHLDQILSDIPFLFFVYLALLLLSKLTPEKSVKEYVLAGAAIFAAFLIRNTGVILLAGFLAHQAYIFYSQQEHRKTVAFKSTVVVGVFTLLWLASSLIFPNGQGAYFYQLAGFTLENFLTVNMPGYFYLGAQFLGIQPGTAWMVVYYALLVLFLIGAWTRRNADLPIILFFMLYLGAMLIWPEWQGIRFLFPILPLFIYFAFQGVNILIGLLPKNQLAFGRFAVSLLWLALAGVFLFNSGTRAYSNLRDNRQINGPFESYSDEVFRFIQEETPPDSVIVFFKPRAMRLFTERDSIMILECENLTLGDYVVLHKNWEFSQILPQDIPACKLPLTNLFENRKYIVYEVPK